MLSIPADIVALYKQDGVRKNFRVHFPNGEMNDLTNAQIVKESLSFTESLCSQNNFRFGLSEDSKIEFETVGVGQMFGMVIECSIEIDTTSLTALQIAVIQADPKDGTIVLAADSDIGWGFYRIPLGRFFVESCPRNKNAMTHRSVTAYSQSPLSSLAISPVELFRMNCCRPFSPYVVNLRNFLDASFGWENPSFISDNYTAASEKAWPFGSNVYDAVEVYAYSKYYGYHCKVRVEVTYQECAIQHSGLCSLNLGNTDFSGVYNFLLDIFDEYQLEYYERKFPGVNRYYGSAEEMILRSDINMALPCISFNWNSGSVSLWAPKFNTYAVYNDGTIFSADFPPDGGYATVRIPISGYVALFDRDDGEQYEYYSWTAGSVKPRITRYTSTTTTPYDDVQIAWDCDQKIDVNEGTGFKRTFDAFSGDGVSIKKLYGSTLELCAQFYKPMRDGSYAVTRISETPYTTLQPSDYPDIWWDEYDIAPIGVLKLPDDNSIDISDGLSVYSAETNELATVFYHLSSEATSQLADLTAFVNNAFAPYASTAVFTPVDLQMQGWPWLEAGDSLRITTEDGTVVKTYMLERRLTGIQMLMDDVTATGGEPVGGT